MALESYQLRGKNYDDVVRQLVQTYNVSNGWAVVKVVNRLTALDIVLERNSEQGKETQKETSTDTSKATPTEKVVDADATASDELPSTGTTQPLEAKEIVADEASTSEKPVAVKTTRKSPNKG